MDKHYHAAEVAEHLGVSVNEFNDWLKDEQDFPPPVGTDDDGPYWEVYDLSAWSRWFEEG